MDQSRTQSRPTKGWTGAGVPTEYRPLHKYLQTRFADTVVLTFGQIQDLLGLVLPNRAYLEREWWGVPEASGTSSPVASAWIHADRTATVNLAARTVTFERQRV